MSLSDLQWKKNDQEKVTQHPLLASPGHILSLVRLGDAGQNYAPSTEQPWAISVLRCYKI